MISKKYREGYLNVSDDYNEILKNIDVEINELEKEKVNYNDDQIEYYRCIRKLIELYEYKLEIQDKCMEEMKQRIEDRNFKI